MRIGNAASNQLQLDICGELMDSVFIYGQTRRADFLRFLDESHTPGGVGLCATGANPIGEFGKRAEAAQELFSIRAPCWLAIDRAMKIAQRRSFLAPLFAGTESATKSTRVA